jgi:hypothetical protein
MSETGQGQTSIGEIFNANQGASAPEAQPPADGAAVDPTTAAGEGGGDANQGTGEAEGGKPPADGEGAPPAQGDPKATDGDQSSASGDDGDDDKHKVPRKSLTEERRKRQEAQARAQAIEAQLAEERGRREAYERMVKGLDPDPKPKDPDSEFYENPAKFVEAQTQAVEAKIAERLWAQSRMMVKDANSDYDEAESAFAEAVKANPHLASQFKAHPHPALFAYQTGKTYMEAEKYGGSFDAMREKLREEIRAEERAKIENEFRTKSSAAAASQMTTSGSGARGAGSTTAPAYKGKYDLNKLFPGVT